MGPLLWMIGLFVALVGATMAFMFLKYFKLWLRAFTSGAKINPFTLVFMGFRKVNPHVLVDAKIMAVQAGLEDVTTGGLEAHFLAGGNLRRVVQEIGRAHV